jgi:hypothetical protein
MIRALDRGIVVPFRVSIYSAGLSLLLESFVYSILLYICGSILLLVPSSCRLDCSSRACYRHGILAGLQIALATSGLK